MKKIFSVIAATALFAACTPSYDVLIVGGGASGTAAGLQAARMGTKTLIVEENQWIGGMLTSAGVSCVDGNYRMKGGIFGEFENALCEHYGGWDKLKTGWVSHCDFEPSVAEAIFEKWVAAEKNLKLIKGLQMTGVEKLAKGWKVSFAEADGSNACSFKCRILIDGTELGDVAKACGVKYHIGFDARSYTGEYLAFEEARPEVVQDMTMVMTLKDYGPDADMTIEKPADYDLMNYNNSCKNPLNTDFPKKQVQHDPWTMLTYGKLPNNKFMINWPVEGNDVFANIIEMDRHERDSVITWAKNRTLGFLYFIQTELGYRNLGLADDEYPDHSGLAVFPYHRESRRIEAEHLYTFDQAEKPYEYNTYRTGIAVGDYPVDHHHYASPWWRELGKFWFAQIPSFTLSAGSLIPLEVEDLVVAEKSIGVSNLVNGTTRLQPVVLEIGQCAGVIAALAVERGCRVRDVDVRSIQKALLASGAYIQPFLELKPGTDGFLEAQRIGATGILRGEGRPVAWSNETLFHPDENLKWCELFLEDYYPEFKHCECCGNVTAGEFEELLGKIKGEAVDCGVEDKAAPITRIQAAVAIDHILNPFERPVDFHGNLL